MKKIIIALLSLFMIVSFTTMASAGGPLTNTAGATLSLPDSGAGPGITFSPSPSTLLSAWTSATNFTLISASSKTTTDNGIEYGIDSDSNTIYQKIQATDSAVTATTSATALPAGFKDKAGNDAPTS
jgi:hypothetical protein